MDWVEVLKALANRNRLEIFQYLREADGADQMEGKDGQGVTELAKQFSLAPSTVSEHLKELRRADLVVMNKHGPRVTCSVNLQTLDQLSRFFRPAERPLEEDKGNDSSPGKS
ncbi:MAG TPA: metalloregulator ArsR/SmtB family transcription factor [Bacillota bacterium]|nr:metalloregulator ArsR/SmtB family transcription factor [Bacillota bacterium]